MQPDDIRHKNLLGILQNKTDIKHPCQYVKDNVREKEDQLTILQLSINVLTKHDNEGQHTIFLKALVCRFIELLKMGHTPYAKQASHVLEACGVHIQCQIITDQDAIFLVSYITSPNRISDKTQTCLILGDSLFAISLLEVKLPVKLLNLCYQLFIENIEHNTNPLTICYMLKPIKDINEELNTQLLDELLQYFCDALESNKTFETEDDVSFRIGQSIQILSATKYTVKVSHFKTLASAFMENIKASYYIPTACLTMMSGLSRVEYRHCKKLLIPLVTLILEHQPKSALLAVLNLKKAKKYLKQIDPSHQLLSVIDNGIRQLKPR